MARAIAIVFVSVTSVALAGSGSPRPVVTIGSKAFTESVILCDIIGIVVRSAGGEPVYKRQLIGTQVAFAALLSGEIDVYPEYTGTLAAEIFAGQGLADEDAIREALQAKGIRMSRPLGFNNTYILGMKEAIAAELGIRTISDLRQHPALRLGFSNEFMDRADGWPGLQRRYGLVHQQVRGLEHDLAYRGLDNDEIDVIDLYSTDAEIKYYNLRSLTDDLGHFPDYQAVLLYRDDLQLRSPAMVDALLRLEGRISEAGMIAMNARAKLDRMPEVKVAAAFVETVFGERVEVEVETMSRRIARRTGEHLLLVAISLAAAIFVSVPLGIIAARHRRLGQVILVTVGVIQTIPSIALLAFMIPLFGLGVTPAVMALFLYSLLPIVRNTFTGLSGIPRCMRESAEALGLPQGAMLWRIELPMASRSILGGIKTSAVINVGTATLGGFIAAGGYGQLIFSGIRLNDVGLILAGAVPAAVLAIIVQGLFDMIDRLLVPKGLRLKPTD